MSALFQRLPERSHDAESGQAQDQYGHKGSVSGQQGKTGGDADDQNVHKQKESGIPDSLPGEQVLEGLFLFYGNLPFRFFS